MNHTQLAKPTTEYLAELQKLQASLRTIVTTLQTILTTPFTLETTNAHITTAIDTLNDHLLHLHIIERGLLAMGVTLTEPKIFNKAFRSHEDFVHHERSSLSAEGCIAHFQV